MMTDQPSFWTRHYEITADAADLSTDLTPLLTALAPSFPSPVFPLSRALGTDTDSLILQIWCRPGQDPRQILAQANLHLPHAKFDLLGDCKGVAEYLGKFDSEERQELLRLQKRLGAFGDESFPGVMLKWVGLCAKQYSKVVFHSKNSQLKEDHRCKGVPLRHMKASHELCLKVQQDGLGNEVSFPTLTSAGHKIFLEWKRKKALCPLNDKVYQLSNRYCRPHGHCRNLYWPMLYRLDDRMSLVQNIRSFLAEPPAQHAEWGSPIRKIMNDQRWMLSRKRARSCQDA